VLQGGGRGEMSDEKMKLPSDRVLRSWIKTDPIPANRAVLIELLSLRAFRRAVQKHAFRKAAEGAVAR